MFQGDPTETALLAAAVDAGLDPMALGRRWPRRREIPFDPAVRLMATYHEAEGRRLLCVKGAPAAVLEASIQYETRAGLAPLTEETEPRSSRQTGRWPAMGCACSRWPGAPRAGRREMPSRG